MNNREHSMAGIRTVVVAIALAVVIFLLGSTFKFQKPRQLSKEELQAFQTQQAQKQYEQQVVSILQKVSSLVAIPNEIPQLAVVQDAEKIRTEKFFVNASNGDVVLVYADKVILYNPTANKVINMGSNTFFKIEKSAKTEQADSSAQKTSFVVDVLNGNSVKGAAAQFQKDHQLPEGVAYGKVVGAQGIKDATGVMVYMQNPALTAAEIQKLFPGATIATSPLPATEQSTADVVVVVGK